MDTEKSQIRETKMPQRKKKKMRTHETIWIKRRQQQHEEHIHDNNRQSLKASSFQL